MEWSGDWLFFLIKFCTDWYKLHPHAKQQQQDYWSTRNFWRIDALFLFLILIYFLFCIYKISSSACQREKNLEQAQPTTSRRGNPGTTMEQLPLTPRFSQHPYPLTLWQPAHTTTLLVTKYFTCKLCEF